VVQIVQLVQPLRSVKSPTSFLPRDAGEDEGGGLSGLNCLNARIANLKMKETNHDSTVIH
jgi:hypothetical protein